MADPAFEILNRKFPGPACKMRPQIFLQSGAGKDGTNLAHGVFVVAEGQRRVIDDLRLPAGVGYKRDASALHGFRRSEPRAVIAVEPVKLHRAARDQRDVKILLQGLNRPEHLGFRPAKAQPGTDNPDRSLLLG